MPEPYYRRLPVHPAATQGGAEATRAGDDPGRCRGPQAPGRFEGTNLVGRRACVIGTSRLRVSPSPFAKMPLSPLKNTDLASEQRCAPFFR